MKSSLEQEFALHLPKGNKPWFEGWYVRVQTKEISFAIIFGLQISNAKKSAFIQFLDTHTKKSRYVEYPWKAVTIQQHPFVLNIRGNRLSMNSVTLRLPQLQADLLHSSLTRCILPRMHRPLWVRFPMCLWNVCIPSFLCVTPSAEQSD